MMRKVWLALALSMFFGVATAQLLDQGDSGSKAAGACLSSRALTEATATISGRVWFAPCCDCSGTGDVSGLDSTGVGSDCSLGGDDDDDDGGAGSPGCCSCVPVGDELASRVLQLGDDDDGGDSCGSGATGIGGVIVHLFDEDENLVDSQVTSLTGTFSFRDLAAGTYQVMIDDLTLSPGLVPVLDFDGVETPDSAVVSVASGEVAEGVDFGFAGCAPGTGTIGYWKNHPEAWPEEVIVVGEVTYSKDEAIALMGRPGRGDKTYDLFKQLVAAKLNVAVGNPGSCVAATIAAADEWLVAYPVGSGVRGSSTAWATGGPLHAILDDYNNGLLCAFHRD
ncbi:MAG TPA: SdrD B-like domain-containing protein [Thermoanaerobaculia bacterium]|nr:SdrD B-like domain-containing protein [Thermoanaerobaculia bacterium]